MKSLIFFTVLILFGNAYADPLVVAINQTLKHSDPESTNRIKAALKSTGLELEFIEMPSERAIQALQVGTVDIDPYRTKQAVENIKNVSQIKPKINSRTYYLYTSAKRKELCNVSHSDLVSFSVAGILGVRLFEHFVYPQFGSFINVVGIEQAMKLVAIQRYDFGIWEQNVFRQVSAHELFDQLYVCDSKPIVAVDFFSYINKKHESLIPLIESAYKEYFAETSN